MIKKIFIWFYMLSSLVNPLPKEEIPLAITPPQWYDEAISWAEKNKIAKEINPNSYCNRGDAVTYIYNYKKGQFSVDKTQFIDVPTEYIKPVGWAVNTGITTGTSSNTFSPFNTTTRGQIVTFLWRMAGKPNVNCGNPFKDVKISDYFYQPVLWAVQKGITTGTSKDTFSPNDTCTKAHILTFLYRMIDDESRIVGNDKAQIDIGNLNSGYVKVQWISDMNKKIKVQIKGPTTTYTYNIFYTKEWVTLPLSDGNGNYKINVYKNVSGSSYASIYSYSFQVALKSEFMPFIRSNQYVNYESANKTIAKADELCKGKNSLDKIISVYDYITNNITYDKELAAAVTSDYLPDLDKVLTGHKGICFDYAALTTGMLRSQGVPCKLVVGYAGTLYHAWISVYIENEGWIDGFIYFDGKTWQRMDPTFASNKGDGIKEYIGDGKNYTAKYFY